MALRRLLLLISLALSVEAGFGQKKAQEIDGAQAPPAAERGLEGMKQAVHDPAVKSAMAESFNFMQDPEALAKLREQAEQELEQMKATGGRVPSGIWPSLDEAREKVMKQEL